MKIESDDINLEFLNNGLQKEIEDILCRVDALPTLDPRTVEEILDYDENGLPT